ncbi:helix-turn-helix domain-containing protein [Pedobacter miscanthi]|uniref:helix-turn-helix domain-containing protein n=2 Tax=Pedobacter TaxID=84567 RepID=UPI0029314B11|nr:helix-turn-helix domain-containing protein [Pedobacter miscanthi]
MKTHSDMVPLLETIADFFKAYGIDMELEGEFACIRLEDQKGEKLKHMPLSRTNFYRIIHLESSHLIHIEGDKKVKVGLNRLIFSYPGKLESWSRTGKLKGTVIYFTRNFIDMDVSHPKYFDSFPFFDPLKSVPLGLQPPEAAGLKFIVDEMILEMRSNRPDKFEMAKKLLAIYLLKIKRIHLAIAEDCSSPGNKNQYLYTQFLEVLECYMRQLAAGEKQVMPSASLLAELLNVTPNRLNKNIMEIRQQTTSSVIQEKVLKDAKTYLLNTSFQVSEIAYKLGFENLSYFNRFFKKFTGITPTLFRQHAIS